MIRQIHLSVKVTGLLVTALFLLATACKKDSTDTSSNNTVTPAPPSKTQLLTSKNWVVTALTCNPAYMGSTDMYQMIPACSRDNLVKFNNDSSRTVTFDEGSAKCNASDPQTTTDTWTLKDNDATLLMGKDNYKVESLDASTLKLSCAVTMDGKNYMVTETYGHQ